MQFPAWLRAAGTLGILLVVLWRFPIGKLFEALRTANLVWFLPAFALTLAMLYFRHVKWHRLLRAGGLPVKPADSLRSLLCGFALSVPTPGRLGDLGRCLFLPEAVRGPVLKLNILERVLDGWAVYTYATASLLVIQFRPFGIFALAVWLAVLPAFAGLPGWLSSISGWKIWRGAILTHLEAGSATLAKIRTAPFAAYSLLTTSLDMFIFRFLLLAFHPANFKASMIAFPWMIMAAGLPISIGGIGPREGVAALILARHAVPAAAAVDAALLLFVFSCLFPAAVGGIWMLGRRKAGAGRRTRVNGAIRGMGGNSPRSLEG